MQRVKGDKGETTVKPTNPTMRSMLGSGSGLPKADAVDKAKSRLGAAAPENFGRSIEGGTLMRAQFRVLKELFLQFKPSEIKGVKLKRDEFSWQEPASSNIPK